MMESQSPVTVLHVDDDATARGLLGQLLRSEGFQVVPAATGHEALSLVAGQPDVILLDVCLPDLSGFEVCRRLKAEPATARIPIIQLSGYFTHPDDRVHGLEDGADAYLTKPVEPRELIAHMRALVRDRQTEQGFRSLAENVPDIIARFDRAHRHLFVNRQVERVTGKRAGEFIGKTNRDLGMPPRLVEFWDGKLEEAARGGQPVTMEFAYPAVDGLRHFEARLVPELGPDRTVATTLCVCSDITDRKQAEQALRHLAAIVESSQDAIIGMTLDGVITSWNAGAVRIYGYSAAEASGQPVAMLAPPERQDEVARVLDRLRQGAPSEQLETVRVRKDGRPVAVSLSVSPIRDDQGVLSGISTIARDITAHRQLEEQFRHAQKMEAVGQLAGGVAHDFNNLLTVINGYSELLLSALPANVPTWQAAAQIHRAGERAAALTRQLLAFSRQAVLDPQVLDLNAVVLEIDKMLRRLIGEDIELATALQPEIDRVFVDPGQIDQVIINLVVNARDAMPQGGQLTLETRNVELDESYAATHLAAKPGHYVMLAVTDTGCGMPPEIKARIFEPFFTTKATGKGTGLGLATVYGIIKQSGGGIEVYSEIGVGTTFKIYLPAVGRAAAVAPAAPAAIPGGTETLLLVEDDAAVRGIALLALESCGYRVLAAAGAREALRLADEHRDAIDLLVTDVVMPEMNGRQVAAAVKARCPAARVLYLSGYTDGAVIRHGILETEVAFLQKPFKPSDLASKVRTLLDQPARVPG